MRLIFVLFLFSCTTDVSISKTNTTEPSEETVVIDDSSSEPAEEPSSEMTDLTIGFSELYFRQIACPACVGESNEFDITATLKLHHPTSGDYSDWLTPVGTCTTNIVESHVSNQPLVSSQTAYFNSIALAPVGTGEWGNNYIYEHQYERSTSYTITSEHGTIQSAFESLEGFDYIEPYTLLWIDPSYAFEATISKSGTTFTWAPIVSNSQFEILVAVYSPDGSQFLGAVSCMEDDVGYMNIPGSYFQSYPYWSLTAVYLTRHRTDLIAVPELNGWLESHMRWEVVGTGHVE